MKALIILALALTPIAAEAKGKKPKPAPVVVQPAPVAPTPAPAAPQPSFMEQQIARALANNAPRVGAYDAAAALQSGGVEAAEAASGGW